MGDRANLSSIDDHLIIDIADATRRRSVPVAKRARALGSVPNKAAKQGSELSVGHILTWGVHFH